MHLTVYSQHMAAGVLVSYGGIDDLNVMFIKLFFVYQVGAEAPVNYPAGGLLRTEREVQLQEFYDFLLCVSDSRISGSWLLQLSTDAPLSYISLY